MTSLLQKLAVNKVHPIKQFPRHSLAINQNVRTEAPQANSVLTSASKADELSIDENKFAEKLKQHRMDEMREDLEHVPRLTVIKFVQSKMDECFAFLVAKGQAEDYVSAMRQVLSRARRKALKAKMNLEQFRMLLVEVNERNDCDEVVLMRTKSLNPFEENAYDALFRALVKQDKPNEEK